MRVFIVPKNSFNFFLMLFGHAQIHGLDRQPQQLHRRFLMAFAEVFQLRGHIIAEVIFYFSLLFHGMSSKSKCQ